MSATYLNTDLILRTNSEPSDLIQALDKSPITMIFSGQPLDSPWTTVFETESQEADAKVTIKKLLSGVSRLPKNLKSSWDACERKTLDIGFQCEGAKFCSEHVVPHDLVTQAAEFGLEIQITIYREEQAEDVKSYPVQDNAD